MFLQVFTKRLIPPDNHWIWVREVLWNQGLEPTLTTYGFILMKMHINRHPLLMQGLIHTVTILFLVTDNISRIPLKANDCWLMN
ncbi:hypothetical protein D3C80_770820 [compost metagenome]